MGTTAPAAGERRGTSRRRALAASGSRKAAGPTVLAGAFAGLAALATFISTVVAAPAATPAPAAAAATAEKAELTGRVEALSHGRSIPGEAEQAIVSFRPDAPVAMERPAQPYRMSTRDKAFDPRVLAVPRGATVAFPNRDPILHNVFSVSEPSRFDLGLYGEGHAETVTFDHPGVVRVFCNVHHGMVGYVVVLDTPFYTSPDAGGRFRLGALPPGPGTLTVWHEQAEPWSRHVEVAAGSGQDVQVTIELSKPRIPPHLNKFGRSYRRSRRGRYRGH